MSGPNSHGLDVTEERELMESLPQAHRNLLHLYGFVARDVSGLREYAAGGPMPHWVFVTDGGVRGGLWLPMKETVGNWVERINRFKRQPAYTWGEHNPIPVPTV
jgi:hypothetical protein